MRFCAPHRDARGQRAFRRCAHHELRLPAGSESVSSGEGNVGRGEDRERQWHDYLRCRVPGRHSESWDVWGTADDAAIASRVARHDHVAGIFSSGSMAGAGSGADPTQSESAGESRRSIRKTTSGRAIRAYRRYWSGCTGSIEGSRPEVNVVRPASGPANRALFKSLRIAFLWCARWESSSRLDLVFNWMGQSSARIQE